MKSEASNINKKEKPKKHIKQISTEHEEKNKTTQMKSKARE